MSRYPTTACWRLASALPSSARRVRRKRIASSSPTTWCGAGWVPRHASIPPCRRSLSGQPMNDFQTAAKTDIMRNDDEGSFIDILIVIAKRKLLVVGFPAVAAVVAASITLLLPDYYTGVAKILPPQQTPETSSVIAQLGNLAGLAGGAAAAGLKNPNDLYVGMLRSRSVADSLIQRFDLNRRYDEKYQSLTRKRLERETTITAGKDGIITIQVDDRDPKRAADLANGYVHELFKLTKVLAVTEASQRRLFFERPLEQAKQEPAKSEA